MVLSPEIIHILLGQGFYFLETKIGTNIKGESVSGVLLTASAVANELFMSEHFGKLSSFYFLEFTHSRSNNALPRWRAWASLVTVSLLPESAC